MSGTFINDPKLLGPMTGLLYGYNALVELLIHKGVILPEELASLLQQRADEWRSRGEPMLFDAANVLDQMKNPLVSSDRNNARKLLNEPPQGKA